MEKEYTMKEQEQYNLLRGKAKQIYAKLRGMATTCSKVFESVESLAKDFNLTPRGVYKIIDRLEKSGLIKVKKELIGNDGQVKRYRNNYYFPLANGEFPETPKVETQTTPEQEIQIKILKATVKQLRSQNATLVKFANYFIGMVGGLSRDGVLDIINREWVENIVRSKEAINNYLNKISAAS